MPARKVQVVAKLAQIGEICFDFIEMRIDNAQ